MNVSDDKLEAKVTAETNVSHNVDIIINSHNQNTPQINEKRNIETSPKDNTEANIKNANPVLGFSDSLCVTKKLGTNINQTPEGIFLILIINILNFYSYFDIFLII